MMALEVPQCVPVLTRDQQHHTDSLPRYLVIPGNLVDCVKHDHIHAKLIDLGEGSTYRSQHATKKSNPLQHSSVPKCLKTFILRYKCGHRKPFSIVSRHG